MAYRARGRRKRPLPDWVGESYKGKSQNEKPEENDTGRGTEKQSDSSNPEIAAGAQAVKLKCAGSCKQPQQNHDGKTCKALPANSSSDTTDGVPLSAEEIIRLSLPLLKFDGSLVYSHNTSDCSVLCEEMMSHLSSEDLWHVGFDMEWPVSYSVGAGNKVALIQICTSEDKCYLFHIAAMGTLPKALKAFLSHKQVIKYGINIEADFWKLERDFDIQVLNIIRESVKDLSKIANDKLKSAEKWTLDGLTRNVFRKRLNKEGSVRCGRWDQYPLSEEQIEYAAMDAYASFLLANHLRNK